MKFVQGRPPIYNDIVRYLGIPRGDAYFTWGDLLYGPGPVVSEPLLAHEEVHVKQQRKVGGPEKWWAKYLSDRAFRAEQEIEAYRAQYRVGLKGLSLKEARKWKVALAKQLSGPLYGRMMSLGEAAAVIERV